MPDRKKQHVLVVVHGARELTAKTHEFLEILQAQSELELDIHNTRRNHTARDIIEGYTDYINCIVAIGGDGTFHEALNGLMSLQNKPLLALVPNGTGNDFLKNFSPFKPEDVVNRIVAGKSNAIDCGRLTFENSERYFINIADLGFGAEVVRYMEDQREKKGKANYSKSILKTFKNYRRQTINYIIDGESKSDELLMFIIGNGHTFGNGLKISPEASLVDGTFNLTVIKDVSLFLYLRKLGKIKKGKRIQHEKVDYLTATKIEFEPQDHQFVEADGELLCAQNLDNAPRTFMSANPKGSSRDPWN